MTARVSAQRDGGADARAAGGCTAVGRDEAADARRRARRAGREHEDRVDDGERVIGRGVERALCGVRRLQRRGGRAGDDRPRARADGEARRGAGDVAGDVGSHVVAGRRRARAPRRCRRCRRRRPSRPSCRGPLARTEMLPLVSVGASRRAVVSLRPIAAARAPARPRVPPLPAAASATVDVVLSALIVRLPEPTMRPSVMRASVRVMPTAKASPAPVAGVPASCCSARAVVPATAVAETRTGLEPVWTSLGGPRAAGCAGAPRW